MLKRGLRSLTLVAGAAAAGSRGVMEEAWANEKGFKRQLLVVAGPSGVGKGTIVNRLTEKNPGSFGFSVSSTTRAPRAGEVDGVHYHFMDMDKYKGEVAAGKFLEFAEVHANMYGTKAADVDSVIAKGQTCILDIDFKGTRQVVAQKAKYPTMLTVFVKPPSMEELERRLRGRATDSEEAIQRRLKNAIGEIEASTEPGLFELVIVNENVEASVSKIESALRS